MAAWRAASVAKHTSPFCTRWLRLHVASASPVGQWHRGRHCPHLPGLPQPRTWLLTGLYLSPGLFRIISSCLRLKLDTPIDFAKPASLHASIACKESKDRWSPRCWVDSLEHVFRNRWKKDHSWDCRIIFAAAELIALLARGLVLSRYSKLHSHVDSPSRPNPTILYLLWK